MSFKTLISSPVLTMHIEECAIIDCRFKLDDVAWGEREYAAGHIPGAIYANLDRDLSGPKTGTNGRHPLPDPDALRHTFGRFGIGNGVQVVAYDQDNGMYASRLWWLLRWLGHDAVAVLDGGLARWKAEARPITSGVETRAPQVFSGEPNPNKAIGVAEMTTLTGKPDWRLVDARAPERYRGDVEPIDRVPGHIPGASNHFFQSNLGADGTFRSPEELRARWHPTVGDTPADHIVCYCGSGVTACHNLLALEHAGIEGAKLYPGSWSEWSSDPSRAVERG